jgi:hypothetical protein
VVEVEHVVHVERVGGDGQHLQDRDAKVRAIGFVFEDVDVGLGRTDDPGMLASLLRREAEECLTIALETHDPDTTAEMLAAAAAFHQGAERLEMVFRAAQATSLDVIALAIPIRRLIVGMADKPAPATTGAGALRAGAAELQAQSETGGSRCAPRARRQGIVHAGL